MRTFARAIGVVAAFSLLLTGCGGGGGGGGPAPTGDALLLLAAGPNAIAPAPAADASDVDLARLGVSGVDSVYEVTTPAGEPFSFDVLSRGEGNSGTVRVSVAHAKDGAATPNGGTETMANAGVIPGATGTSRRAEWLDARGDGFARITLGGAIERDQAFVVETESGGETSRALVRVEIGPESAINRAAAPAGDYPGVTETADLYSSDSWNFGLPAVAVSGDRTSVVCYEGDRADPGAWGRFELRLQHGPDGVRGGGTVETGPDTGHWRDHEIAALYNVLAVARGGDGKVTLKLSFDRGATFGQVKTFGAGESGYHPRLVQVAMAADYSLALLYWRTDALGATELALVTGAPAAFDGTGSPTAFTFDPAVTIHRDAADVSPVVLGATWSEGGDLVIGYAFSRFQANDDLTWTSTTENRCAVVPHDGELRDALVERDVVVGRDPSVSVVGSGDTMRVFFAYEGRDGIRLRTSDDGGRTFSAPITIGDGSATNPMVFAREQEGALRVDVVHLAQGEQGQELRLAHWDDFDGSAPESFRLTTATMTGTGELPPGSPMPGLGGAPFLPDSGYRITQIAWFGYDAVLDGDDVVIVYDEETFDAYTMFVGPPMMDFRFADEAMADAAAGAFVPAEPPPLAEGMTEVLPAPDPTLMHQLRLMRLD